ncbi:permease-like cell division protein FtsX, partial [bacterium]|nr:permease-like cell division protein FtsX [bacterium]
LAELKDKVDVNIYFTLDAPEEEIFGLKQSLESLPAVAYVSYTSRDQALESFEEKHADDYTTLQALEELDGNPLPASLNIKAKEASQYETIARFLEDKNALMEGDEKIVEKVTYYQNKTAIDKLASIIAGAERLGLAITFTLIAISILITFNTIRLAIYTSRQEISIMKLMGAGNAYIRGPFIVEGIMYGAISALAAMALFYPVTLWIGDATAKFFSGINVHAYYIDHLISIFGSTLLAGIFLGAVSSAIAVSKYLNEKHLKMT